MSLSILVLVYTFTSSQDFTVLLLGALIEESKKGVNIVPISGVSQTLIKQRYVASHCFVIGDNGVDLVFLVEICSIMER